MTEIAVLTYFQTAWVLQYRAPSMQGTLLVSQYHFTREALAIFVAYLLLDFDQF